jgi:hypothetical protein
MRSSNWGIRICIDTNWICLLYIISQYFRPDVHYLSLTYDMDEGHLTIFWSLYVSYMLSPVSSNIQVQKLLKSSPFVEKQKPWRLLNLQASQIPTIFLQILPHHLSVKLHLP